MNSGSQFLNQIRTLNVHQRGDRRAPHKPILLLVAIAKLLQGNRELSFDEAQKQLRPLINLRCLFELVIPIKSTLLDCHYIYKFRRVKGKASFWDIFQDFYFTQ